MKCSNCETEKMTGEMRRCPNCGSKNPKFNDGPKEIEILKQQNADLLVRLEVLENASKEKISKKADPLGFD